MPGNVGPGMATGREYGREGTEMSFEDIIARDRAAIMEVSLLFFFITLEPRVE